MIHFDFEERYQDELIVGSAISRREGVVFSVLIHGALVAVLLLAPGLALFAPDEAELEAQQQELMRQREQERESRQLVFVQPRSEFEAAQPRPDADLSDLDRRSQAPEVAEVPANPLPLSEGTSPELVDVPPQPDTPEERAQGPDVPEPPSLETAPSEPEEQIARLFPPAGLGLPRPSEVEVPAPRAGGGSLGDALRNLDRYVQQETFSNPQGGVTDPGATIQFDTKGIEFGPWLRRFVAQVRRNWFVPTAAMTFRGRVVLQFNIHRDGRITDVNVAQPSDIDAFNRAAFNAILGSNPTEPLPPEYPEPMAFFTVVFYYNEQPPRPLPGP